MDSGGYKGIGWLVVTFSILHHSEKLPWKRGHALLFLKDVYNRKILQLKEVIIIIWGYSIS